MMESKTGIPVRFEITDITLSSLERWIRDPEMIGLKFLLPSRIHGRPRLSTRRYTRIVRGRVTPVGLEPGAFGTHSMRRTKVVQVYKKTGNLRAVQLLLGHTKMDGTVRSQGVDIEDALTLAEGVDLQPPLPPTGADRAGRPKAGLGAQQRKRQLTEQSPSCESHLSPMRCFGRSQIKAMRDRRQDGFGPPGKRQFLAGLSVGPERDSARLVV